MRLAVLPLAVCGLALAAGGPASASAGYRANLVSCIMGKRSCDARALKEADHDYLREEPGARTRDPYMAGKIADARMRPVRIVVSERRLDHLHARDVEFERYRSTVRALRHGWVPGASYPYEQPPRAWAPSERRALERDVARERSTYGYPY